MVSVLCDVVITINIMLCTVIRHAFPSSNLRFVLRGSYPFAYYTVYGLTLFYNSCHVNILDESCFFEKAGDAYQTGIAISAINS